MFISDALLYQPRPKPTEIHVFRIASFEIKFLRKNLISNDVMGNAAGAC